MSNLGKKIDGRNSASTTAPRKGSSFLWALICIPLLGSCMPMEPSNRDETARSELGYIKHEQDNIDVELRLFEGRVETLEETLSLLKQEVADQQQASLKQVNSQMAQTDDRIVRLQSLTDEFSRELRELKTLYNDLGASFSQYKRRFGEIEQVVDRQGRNINNLEAALRSLTTVIKEGPPSGSIAAATQAKVYRVQSGDTLEKIAKAHNVTVRQIKESNRMTDDLIIAGQELAIPR